MCSVRGCALRWRPEPSIRAAQPSNWPDRHSPLPESSLLQTTAEVSVSLAGFVGVFLALERRDGAFTPGDAFLIRVLILCCVPPIFFSVLPIILHSLGLSEMSLWRCSSAISGALIALISINIFRTQHSVKIEGPGNRLQVQSTISYSMAILALAAHLSNTIGWPWAPSGGLFLVALWLILSIGGITFTQLILHRVL